MLVVPVPAPVKRETAALALNEKNEKANREQLCASKTNSNITRIYLNIIKKISYF